LKTGEKQGTNFADFRSKGRERSFRALVDIYPHPHTNHPAKNFPLSTI
jgi:hypothetical protein